MKLLFLATTIFNEEGGIAVFNTNFVTALAKLPSIVHIDVLVNNQSGVYHDEQNKIRVIKNKRNLFKYLFNYIKVSLKFFKYDIYICGHINYLPLASLLAFLHRKPLLLIVHGIEAWSLQRKWLTQLSIRRVSTLVSVSDYTKQRMKSWCQYSIPKYCLLPNAVDLIKFTPGEKDKSLQDQHNLQGKKVLLTLCRLSKEERYKGVDKVLEILPDLLKKVPDGVYVVAGTGDDQARLIAKAHDLGVDQNVRFIGWVETNKKIQLYRTADLFVMPGKGEGFGIVYLEAIACGIPVIGSIKDGSKEALLNGELGYCVDPDNDVELLQVIVGTLLSNQHRGLHKIQHYSYDNFCKRVANVLET